MKQTILPMMAFAFKTNTRPLQQNAMKIETFPKVLGNLATEEATRLSYMT